MFIKRLLGGGKTSRRGIIADLSRLAQRGFRAYGTDEKAALPRASLIGAVVGAANFIEADSAAEQLWDGRDGESMTGTLVFWKAICTFRLFEQMYSSAADVETRSSLVAAECEASRRIFGLDFPEISEAWLDAYFAALTEPRLSNWANTLFYWGALESLGGRLGLQSAPIGAGSMKDFISAPGSESVLLAVDRFEGASHPTRSLAAATALAGGVAAGLSQLDRPN